MLIMGYSQVKRWYHQYHLSSLDFSGLWEYHNARFTTMWLQCTGFPLSPCEQILSGHKQWLLEYWPSYSLFWNLLSELFSIYPKNLWDQSQRKANGLSSCFSHDACAAKLLNGLCPLNGMNTEAYAWKCYVMINRNFNVLLSKAVAYTKQLKKIHVLLGNSCLTCISRHITFSYRPKLSRKKGKYGHTWSLTAVKVAFCLQPVRLIFTDWYVQGIAMIQFLPIFLPLCSRYLGPRQSFLPHPEHVVKGRKM